MANFDTMWDVYPDFRTGIYVISYLWAAWFLIQAAGTAPTTHQTRSPHYNDSNGHRRRTGERTRGPLLVRSAR